MKFYTPEAPPSQGLTRYSKTVSDVGSGPASDGSNHISNAVRHAVHTRGLNPEMSRKVLDVADRAPRTGPGSPGIDPSLRSLRHVPTVGPQNDPVYAAKAYRPSIEPGHYRRTVNPDVPLPPTCTPHSDPPLSKFYISGKGNTAVKF
jgi:hypothetical protein